MAMSCGVVLPIFRQTRVSHFIYPLLSNSSPWYRWPIEIDGLAINSMVIFHGYVSHNQMVMFPPYVHMMSFDVFCTQEMMGCCLSNDIVKIPEF